MPNVSPPAPDRVPPARARDLITLIDPLVHRLKPAPVLVDVGASAEVPAVWRPLARRATYVGFDPDLREMRRENGGQFHRAFVLNEAVTADPAAAAVTFRLTRFPQCSSTLLPDRAVVDNYLFGERFDVQRESAVPATTVDAALARVGLAHVDWLKLDTQGTDLRLFDSLSDGVRNGLLAVDAEPGLRGAYRGEDLFGDLHAGLVRRGFWCAAAAVKGWPRVRPATLAALADGMGGGGDPRGGARGPTAGPEALGLGLPPSPGWVECRYLRTCESLAAADDGGDPARGRRAHVLLWAFAMAAGQPGFAGDAGEQYARRYGSDADARAMAAATAGRVRHLWAEHHRRQARQNGLVAHVRRRIRRAMDRLGVRA